MLENTWHRVDLKKSGSLYCTLLKSILQWEIRKLAKFKRKEAQYFLSSLFLSPVSLSLGERLIPYVCIIFKWNCSHPTDSASLTTQWLTQGRVLCPDWVIDSYIDWDFFNLEFFFFFSVTKRLVSTWVLSQLTLSSGRSWFERTNLNRP